MFLWLLNVTIFQKHYVMVSVKNNDVMGFPGLYKHNGVTIVKNVCCKHHTLTLWIKHFVSLRFQEYCFNCSVVLVPLLNIFTTWNPARMLENTDQKNSEYGHISRRVSKNHVAFFFSFFFSGFVCFCHLIFWYSTFYVINPKMQIQNMWTIQVACFK